ncbi:hypothetical protein OKA05_26235 [Luteolibacter arcticus]|uniref:Uncharacterized protein n=1 Tax=Luteolibacter arcticus TaxID=1581411 RepID=A0ABT3GRD6_9BACT|nr:hypothetical protein [Luteolibacter arcticus]MCW1926086.1 hypothetical protein [Luteolibacter arcticus]
MELEPDQRTFVDAVMRPLGDDPSRRETLEGAVALASTWPSAATGDDALTAADRMNRTSRGFLARHRILSAALLATWFVVAWFAIAGPGARGSLSDIWEVNEIANSVSSLCCSHAGVPRLPKLLFLRANYDDKSFAKQIGSKVSPAQLHLLIGEPTELDPVVKWKRVWERHPRDPAHYYAYALAHRKELGNWPENFVETGEELDPGNGWFRLLAGASEVKSAVGEPPPPPRITRAERLAAREKGLPPPSTPKPSKPQRQVIDPAGFQKGWRLLEEALSMPRWDDYGKRLDSIRLAAVPPPDDFAAWSRGIYFSILQPEDTAANWVELKSYHEGFGLAATGASKAADSERLASLDDLLRRFVRRLGTVSRTQLIDSLMVRATALSGGRAMEKTWSEIGDPSKAKRWKDFTGAIDPKLKPDPTPAPDALSKNLGSNFVVQGMAFSSSRRSPDSAKVSETDLRGGRLAEYAVYERLMMHGMAVLLLLALGFLFIASFIQRKEVGLLDARIAGLLDHRDRLAILTVGVILPAIVYLFSTRMPWLGFRDESISEIGFMLWIAQSVAFAVSVLLGTLQVARQRLGRRGALLALGWVGPDPGRLCFPAALAIMPLASIVPRVMGPWPDALAMAAVMLGCLLGFPLIWLIIQAVGCFNGPQARKLHRSVLMSAAHPFIAIAIILPCLAILWVHAEEKAWTREIRFESLADTSFFGSRLEREYGDWIVRQILMKLDALEK